MNMEDPVIKLNPIGKEWLYFNCFLMVFVAKTPFEAMPGGWAFPFSAFPVWWDLVGGWVAGNNGFFF
jgi:hypothetical protein